MSRTQAKRRLVFGLGLILGMAIPITAQTTAALQRRPVLQKPSPPRPASLSHLYWHFLMYQRHLDEKAALLSSQGKNTDALRNFLQRKLGFSDAEFAPVRASGARLASEIKTLNGQAAAIVVNGPTASSQAQLQTLTVQRETYINAEVTTLRQALPLNRIAQLESAITKMFSPSNATTPPSNLVPLQSTPAVQQ